MDCKIAVLIPTKNRKELLERALNSIFVQERLPEEVVVVNDGSVDGTEEFLLFFSNEHKNVKWKIVNRKLSGGVNVARNQGVKLSLCDWVVFLDDDDELLPNAISLVGESIKGISDNYNVAYFNSLILRGGGEFEGGFQFKNLKKNLDFYDPTYEETLTKFNLKGDCKPALKKTLFDNEKYLFPESVNGFESYTMNIIAKDKKGIRYYNSIITKIHQEDELKDRLSISASAKNPWPLFVLHFKQIFQHFRFYISHPLFFLKKLKEMLKLFVRSVLKFFGF